jgi:predicted RNA methylase
MSTVAPLKFAPTETVLAQAVRTPGKDSHEMSPFQILMQAPQRILVALLPTPDDVVQEMLAMAEVTARDIVYDLGSGDGRIILAAARFYGSKAVGYETDPELVEQSRSLLQCPVLDCPNQTGCPAVRIYYGI